MAKFGWNEEALFYVSDVSMQDNVADPGAPSAEEGSLRIYSSDAAGSQRLYIRDSVEAIMIPIDAVDAPAITGQSLVKGKNSDGELEFYSLKSTSGHLDIALNGDDIELTVDLSDINDELDHGLLLGLADDDHAQYLLLAGRSGGQIANGGIDASDDLELKSTANATKGEVKIIDGSDFRHNKYVWKSATVQTSDDVGGSENEATPFTVALDDAKSYLMEVKVVAQSTDKTERAMFIQSQGVYRDGVAILQGNQNSQHKTRTSGQMTVTFSVTGGGGDVMVDVSQGTLDETIDWSCELEILELS